MRQVGITLRLLLTGCYLQVDTVIYADSAVRG